MNADQEITPLRSFVFEGKEQQVYFVETMYVTDGVKCDVYTFSGDQTKDLGIIRVNPGSRTPLQMVLKGDRTIEGYISGKGKLTITNSAGKQQVFVVNEELKEPVTITVAIGELMQWEADGDSNLKAYEICFPPYKDGRYKNIEHDL